MQANPADIERESTLSSTGHMAPSSSNPSRLDNPSAQPDQQRLVFTDPIALRYLEEDSSAVVLDRRSTLQGYEIYIVEQWACSRIHPTFVITTYTGDLSHTVLVGVLSVPTDESTWSPRLKLYFNAVTEYHARKRETSLGTIMVTDLGTFPSALTVIPVPGGDFKRHRDDFIVNEDLKRLGCSGRAGLKLQFPSAATEAKFHQLYRTSERVPLYTAVTELVKQCQIALVMFDKLAPEYVDGLLCDVTEAAIRDWWTDIGTELYNVEPSDGVMGPMTVAALLGTLLGARNRLHACGAPVGKDAFDISSLKRGIGSFQKSHKLPRTRRLDRLTLEKLHRATAKAASSEGWTGAVKSTVAELGGKGGEMVMGMVAGREKGGIADIETLDIDTFAHLAFGHRAKWLWRGKIRKNGIGDRFADTSGTKDIMFVKDNQGGYVWTSRRRHSSEDLSADRIFQKPERPRTQHDRSTSPDERDQNLSRMVRKGVSDRVSDARIGFGKFKDAVGLPGLRSHHHHHHNNNNNSRHRKDFSEVAVVDAVNSDFDETNPPERMRASSGAGNAISSGAFENTIVEESNGGGLESTAAGPRASDMRGSLPEIAVDYAESDGNNRSMRRESRTLSQASSAKSDDGLSGLERYKSRSSEISSDREQQISDLETLSLRRSQSYGDLCGTHSIQGRDNYWPRHLSFGTVEEAILVWEGFPAIKPVRDDDGLEMARLDEAALREEILAAETRICGARVVELAQETVPWVLRQVDAVDELNGFLHGRYESLDSAYLEGLADYQRVKDFSTSTLAEEGHLLHDKMKLVEMLGAKLDYELNVLESKVEDVESGLGEYERHIVAIETRIKSLLSGEEQQKRSSWMAWFARILGLKAQ